MSDKRKYVKGLTGYQIRTVLYYTIGETVCKFQWSDSDQTYIFYIPDALLTDKEQKKFLDHFRKFWLCKVEGLDKWEGI